MVGWYPPNPAENGHVLFEFSCVYHGGMRFLAGGDTSTGVTAYDAYHFDDYVYHPIMCSTSFNADHSQTFPERRNKGKPTYSFH